MAALVIHMHADREKYGLLKIPLEFSESLTSGAFESGAEPRGVGTPTQLHHQHSAMWIICFFSSPPLSSSVQCTQSPWVYPPHPHPVLCIRTFCVPPFFCCSFPQTNSNTHRNILAFAFSFHPTGTSGSLFWYQGNETLLAKKGFL